MLVHVREPTLKSYHLPVISGQSELLDEEQVRIILFSSLLVLFLGKIIYQLVVFWIPAFPSQIGPLWSLLPSHFAIRNPTLLFSTSSHGCRYAFLLVLHSSLMLVYLISLAALLDRCKNCKPVFILIKDKANQVFFVWPRVRMRSALTLLFK